MHFTANGKLTNKKILTHNKYTNKIYNQQDHSLKSKEKKYRRISRPTGIITIKPNYRKTATDCCHKYTKNIYLSKESSIPFIRSG